MMTLSLMPAARKALGMGSEMLNLMEKVKEHHRKFIYIAIPGLLAGCFLGKSNPIPKGLFSFTNPYDSAMTIKLILLVAMTAIALSQPPHPQTRRGEQGERHAHHHQPGPGNDCPAAQWLYGFRGRLPHGRELIPEYTPPLNRLLRQIAGEGGLNDQ